MIWVMRKISARSVTGLVLTCAILVACGGSREFSPSSRIQGQPTHDVLAPDAAKAGIYVSSYHGTSIYGFNADYKHGRGPKCTVYTGKADLNNIAADTAGNLIVPLGKRPYMVDIYQGPGLCGAKLGEFKDPYGQGDAAASINAVTGTIIVANLHSHGPTGSIAVCTLKNGCTKNLTNPNVTGEGGGIALANNGDCWLTSEDRGLSGAAMTYWKGCAGTGEAATGFENSSYGSLSVDKAGNLLSVDYGSGFGRGSAQLWVYSECNPACVLVGGPFPLAGNPLDGALNAKGDTFGTIETDFPYGGTVDIYKYSPTELSYQYSFNSSFAPVADPEGLAYSPALQQQAGANTPTGNANLWGPNVVAACPHARPREAQCLALIRTGQQVNDGGSGPNGGFTPSQLEAAYNLPSTSRGSGQIVAIVDAYDDPSIASDLATYRSYFGLPAANFTKYNQDGQTGNYPPGNTEWGVEESLDVEMVSASCPDCTIYLVEANSSNIADFETAENEAAALGAHVISNSYACYKPCGFQKSYYDSPGVTYLAASGDLGYGSGIGDPASFDSVVSVGGTSLYVDRRTKRGFSERVWLGTNSGCSHIKKPPWQHDPGCPRRTANDVAALADPATGPAIYDSYGFNGWLVGGGTSTGSPFLAGVFALAGNATSQNGGETFWKKAHESSSDLYHVTHGDNGSCSPMYFCTDGTHEYRDYGGPTGWGTPNGIGAF